MDILIGLAHIFFYITAGLGILFAGTGVMYKAKDDD